MAIKTAQALLPRLTICEESERNGPSETMKQVWKVLWEVSPWLETISNDAFLLQIPGTQPPVREVRDLLLNLQILLTREQRFRVGLAENPFLSRAMVVWSRLERVQGANYFKVREQELLISPGISKWLKQLSAMETRGVSTATRGANIFTAAAVSEREEVTINTNWIHQMPIRSLWLLPTPVLTELWELGLRRLGDLELIEPRQLQRRFGKSAFMWLEWLNPVLGGRVQVNYPPAKLVQSWRAATGERLLPEHYETIVKSMAAVLTRDLERSGTGAMKVGMMWYTEQGKQRFERATKRPVYQLDLFLAQIRLGIGNLPDEGVEQLDLYVKSLQPLTPVQLTFWPEEGGVSFVSDTAIQKREFTPISVSGCEERRQDVLERIMQQVNHKFPERLRVGASPAFRELRLQAVMEINA